MPPPDFRPHRTNSPQRPIGSGFGAQSTASDVLAGIDLGGKTAIVTGGYSGIGLETTRALTAAGAHVVVPARRPDVARDAVQGLADVEVDELDLGDLHSVGDFADRFLASRRSVDIVICGAGIMACPETRVGPGWEAQFATNHLGHFALVNRLWPALADGGGRVVAVSSVGHRRTGMRWDDVHFEKAYDKWTAYGQAKTANVLFAVQLDRLGADDGVRSFALHPGGIMTALQRHLTHAEQEERGWINTNGDVIATFKSPEQGAATQVWAATAPQLEGLGGVYCENCDIADANDDPTARVGVRSWATDADEAARLWTLSAELTGTDAFGATD